MEKLLFWRSRVEREVQKERVEGRLVRALPERRRVWRCFSRPTEAGRYGSWVFVRFSTARFGSDQNWSR